MNASPQFSEPVFPLDIEALLTHAESRPPLRAEASALFLELASNLVKDEGPRYELHASDAGACSRALWSRVNGMEQLGDDLKTQLTRFDGGHLFGAWQAALVSVAATDLYPDVWCECEVPIDWHGTIGRADLVISLVKDDSPNRFAQQVVDFKLTWFSKAEPKKYQVQQVVTYAAAVNAPYATVFTIAPGAYAGKPWTHQENVLTAEKLVDVIAEIDWLKLAVESESRPEGNPREAWRCKTCSCAGCERNERLSDVVRAGLAPEL